MKRFFDRLACARVFLPVLISVNFLLHIPFVNLPPCSIHVWRQCNTLAVARNFANEDMNIFKPRVDRRHNTDGVTGMQFPLYEWMLACIYKLSGEYAAVSRLFSLMLISVSVIALYQFVFISSSSAVAAAVSAASLCFSPEIFYQGFNAMPDVLSICSSCLSLFYLARWHCTASNSWFNLSLIFIMIAGLVKLQYLMFGAFHLVFLFRYYIAGHLNAKHIVSYILAGAITISVPVTWYLYANHLIEESNLRDFGLTFRPASNFNSALSILKDNLLSDLPELLLNYSATILLIIGLTGFIKTSMWKHPLFIPMLITFFIYIVYHLIELNQMADHQYYMLPLMLLLSIACGYGARVLYSKNQLTILMLLILLLPVLACIRIIPARWLNENKALPVEFLDARKLKQLKMMVPANALVLAGPDESGCIYFYFLEKKGFGYNHAEYVKRKNNQGHYYVAECIKLDAQFVYSKGYDWSNDELLSIYIKSEVGRVDDFIVYELKDKDELYLK